MASNNRIFGLDVLRALAILLVVASHCTYLLVAETSHPLFLFIRSLGAVGVDLFFVLSGYLIGGILLNMINHGKTTFPDLFTFWKRRWLRTLPNYFLILLFNILLVSITTQKLPGTVWRYVLFLQNFTTPHPDFFTEAWSLSIEEYAYLIYPFIVYLLFVFIKKQSQQVFLWGVVVTILILLLIKVEFYVSAPNISSYKAWSASFRKVVIYRLDSIYIGFLLYYAINKFSAFFRARRIELFVLSFLMFSGVHLWMYLGNIQVTNHLWFYVFGYLPLVMLCCAAVFPFCIHLKPYGKIRGVFYYLSTRSYAIYLVNYSLILLYVQNYFQDEVFNNLFSFGLIILYLAITILLSELLYTFFEKPILKFRDKTFT